MIELYRKDFFFFFYETYEADICNNDDLYALILCHNFYTDKNVYEEKKVMTDNITHLTFYRGRKAKKLGMDSGVFLEFLKDKCDSNRENAFDEIRTYIMADRFKIRMSMRTLVRDEAGVEKWVDWNGKECKNPVVVRALDYDFSCAPSNSVVDLSSKFDDFEIYKHKKIEMAFRALVMGENLEKDFVGNEQALKNLEKINNLHNILFLVDNDKTKKGKVARKDK